MKVLITGASSGIGMSLAKELAKTNAELVLVGRNEDRLRQLKKELGEVSNSPVTIVSTDLSIVDNCIKLHNDHKGVDLLINNAGFGDTGCLWETDLEKDVAMINTNITATHVLTKLYLQDMMARNAGHILNVASVAGFMPGPRMSTYYASKGYVVRFSEAVREELRRAKSKVKISLLCPGPVNTNFAKNANVDYKSNGISSDYVAKYTIKNLNKFYIVPTCTIKMLRAVMQIMPGKCSAKWVYRYKTPKKK